MEREEITQMRPFENFIVFVIFNTVPFVSGKTFAYLHYIMR